MVHHAFETSVVEASKLFVLLFAMIELLNIAAPFAESRVPVHRALVRLATEQRQVHFFGACDGENALEPSAFEPF